MLAIVPLGKKGSNGIPIVTIFLCVVCAIVYAFANSERDQLALSYYPHTFDVLKMFTSALAHASLWHLVGNLFFFYCFARTIETQISIVGYLLAFVLFVFATNLAYDFSAKEPIPTLGLSGVVWGYMGIFLMRYPKEKIDCFVWYIWIFKTIEVPALIFILAFLAFDVAAYRNVADTGVNHVAHLSGFAAGVLFKLAFWRLFTTEAPAPKKKAPFVLRAAPPRSPRGR
jgi:membrane associated rhomboid family serine protease